MIFVVNYFKHKDKERREEIDFCLKQNLNNSFFKRKIVFVEDGEEKFLSFENREDIEVIKNNVRPTFQNIFDFCNMNCNNKKVVLSNSDIYFDDTIKKIEQIDLNLNFVCLSRWESSDFIREDKICCFSQDSWIFKTPVRINFANFYFGIPRCDGRIAFLAKSFGYDIINPCKTIKSFHKHTSEKRDYVCGIDFVDGDVLYINPTRI